MFKMFELEDYSTGIHDGYLTKYSEPSNATLDFYISDSMQDMLDVDIRSEIENVVGGGDPGFSSVSSERQSLDQALNANCGSQHANSNGSHHNNSNSNHATNHVNNSLQAASLGGSTWYGSGTGASSWSSSSSDFYADIGACVNPISVMPLISSTLIHKSSKSNLNSNGLPPPPMSPNAKETSKSHLTFSPAQMKINSNSIRHEQILSHIPKQIVPISSAVTAATTAPATMATNSALQRKVGAAATAVDAIKKDLVAELRRSSFDDTNKAASALNSNSLLNGSTSTNTIKLAPGIGGLTFANSITYNKLKQQTTAKSPLSSPNSCSLASKRERGSSPLHTATNGIGGGGQTVSKIIARNIVQSANGFTPKSIASAHSPLINSGGSSGSIGSPSSASSMSASSPSSHSSGYNGSFSAGLAPLNGHSLTQPTGNLMAMKSLQQKTKASVIESEYPKPAYSYSCLIAMALKNSRSGSLPVSEIYRFMCEHFPYFNTAPSGWKNSVRHNLSLNKCFEKIEKPATNGNQRKGCLWAMNPERIIKMDEEVQKWSRKDPAAIRNAMVFPENLEALERGEMKHGSLADDAEADSQSDIEDTSDLEEPEDIDETIVDSMFVEEDEDMAMAATNDDIMVVNECENDEEDTMPDLDEIKHEIDSDIDDKDFVQLHQQQQQQRDFDIEVEDFYDSIDIEDDKEAVRMAINQSDIIELCPADLNASSHSPKRARLDVNYSIGPANELEKHLQRQRKMEQQQQQQIKKFRFVQQLQQQTMPQQQQQQHSKQQHFIVQTINGNGSITNTTMTTKKAANIASIVTATSAAGNNNNISSIISNKFTNNNTILTQKQVQHLTQFQQIPLQTTATSVAQHNRRKMQLVNRIA